MGIELAGLVVLLGTEMRELLQLTGEKRLEQGTRKREGIKQDNTGRSSCLMVCKKYLSKEHSALKPRREPEFAVLLQLTGLSGT